ncbi:MAG: dihydroorotate dehydrogenase [Planctomycetota bacterium]|nr:dihydroorotate dehydrogenase [Planctomycetota bacterium]
MTATQAVDLSLRIGSLELQNPVGTASGTYGKGLEFQPFYEVARLGYVVVKTITTEARAGNPPPRLCEIPGGLMNSIGLPNPGVDAYIETVLPKLRTLGAPLVINIAGHDIADFAILARRFAAEEGIDALELNMSCPNVSGGLDYSTDPKVAKEVLVRARAETDLPLIAKLSPNVTDIRPIAEAAVAGGADAISAINTIVGMPVDWRKRRPILGRGFGGISGPCIKPVALRMVRMLYETVDVPIIGIGGIETADDAMEFFVAGASAIQVGTANYYRPTAAIELLEGLPERIASLGATSLQEVIGTLEMP